MFGEDDILIEEKLLNNCKPYLNLLKHHFKHGMKRPLLRGSAQPYDTLTRIPVEERNKPMSMDLENHRIADEWFNEHFGIPARSKTVFTTTNRGLAKHYGIIHYIFPIGKFTIINSPVYSDLFLYMGVIDMTRTYIKLFGKQDSSKLENYDEAKSFMNDLKENEPEKYKEVVHQILEKGEYEKNNYTEAFKNGNEIMLRCKAFYIITAEDETINDFINDFIWDEIYY
jgi:hypothetical protein